MKIYILFLLMIFSCTKNSESKTATIKKNDSTIIKNEVEVTNNHDDVEKKIAIEIFKK